MAYLQFGGVSEQATLQSQVSFSSTDTYVIELTFKIDADTGNDIHAWLGNNALTNYFYYRLSNQLLFWNFDGSTRTLSAPTTSILGIENTVDLICDAGAKTISWDGNVTAPFATPKVFLFDRFGSRGNAWYADGGLRRVRVFSDLAKTTLTYDWSADDSSYAPGTPILSELIANNFATGQNMPTDGSAWVDTGGGAISITEQTSSISIDAINPTVSFFGTLTIQESSSAVTITPNNPTIELTSFIQIQEQTSLVSISSIDPSITLTSNLSITESTSSIQIDAFSPSVTLSGTITIQEQLTQIGIQSIDPFISVASDKGEQIFIGFKKAQESFSGGKLSLSEIGSKKTFSTSGNKVKNQPQLGQKIAFSYNGVKINDMAFDGESKQFSISGVKK